MIDVVIFDWGDTVMRDFPQYAGPMAGWPEVAAMPGITEALRTLAADYRLVLATNAAASGADRARAALARVELDTYFAYVLTAQGTRRQQARSGLFRARVGGMRQHAAPRRDGG